MGKRLTDSALELKVHDALQIIGTGKLPCFNVVLYDSPRPSAFTVSDGARSCILMSAGMVMGLSPKALAGVIAHESGHILEWHPRKQAAILGMLALVKGITGITIVAVILVLFAYLYMLREWEFAADRRAADIVGAAGMIATFEEYRALSGEKDISRLSESMCSHPSLNRRVDALLAPAVAHYSSKLS
jgi:Zn-dependent protease with chaperone function